MGVVDEVKERLDIVDVISSYVPLKKAGRTYKALCPFHTEKTPSFVVFPDTQTWHCFGACGTGGDVFAFVMRRENMEFGEALRLLAERAGVSLKRQTEAQQALGTLKDRLHRINALAAEYFQYLLVNSPGGTNARDYLVKRGISDEIRDLFQLGYAREGWRALGQHLTSKGYSWPDLLEAGLVSEREGGGYYDRFRGRLMFPIRDIRGHVAGFGARTLGDSGPKYLNSPQTPIFDKGGMLYGLDQAKGAVREQGLLVIVEGYMDVLMTHQYGRKNVVASMGTALTEKQVRLLKKLTKRVVLALDSDAAGDQGTLRGLEVARDTFDRSVVPVPTWRGLVRYEGQLNADIRITTLPPGLDPDEVIKEDVSNWDGLIARALPVVEYYLRSILSRFDLDSPKGKAAAAREVLPLIQEISSPVERSHYLQELARMLRVDERVLQQEMEGKRWVRRKPASNLERHGRLSARPGLLFGLERYLLSVLIQRPELLVSMNDLLTSLGLEPLGEEDFGQVEERALFEQITVQIAEHGDLDEERLLQHMDPSLRQEFENLLSLVQDVAAPSDEKAELDAVVCALSLRELHLHRRNEELHHLQEDARTQGDLGAGRRWGQMVDELTTQLAKIQRERAARSSAGHLRREPARG